MPTDEANALFGELYPYSVSDDLVYRHRWEPGMVVLWDNRCAMHNPINDYHGHRRVMNRITLAGDRPV